MSFVVPYEFENDFPRVAKSAIVILIGIVLNPKIVLSSVVAEPDLRMFPELK